MKYVICYGIHFLRSVIEPCRKTEIEGQDKKLPRFGFNVPYAPIVIVIVIVMCCYTLKLLSISSSMQRNGMEEEEKRNFPNLSLTFVQFLVVG